VIDEIQRVPRLLDEVHVLFEQHGYRRFVLTGSSARKLRTGSVNLLGGRARTLKFYPLTTEETDFFQDPLVSCLYGMLPMSVIEVDPKEKERFLKGYLENYLIDEIQRETQIRNFDGFQRFLNCAAICSTQPINFQNIARDAQVSRDSVTSYFQVLEDTLIGYRLPAFAGRVKVKQTQSPKFYFFDSGVLNAAAGYLETSAPSDWLGYLMETWIGHELRAYLDLHEKKGILSYWRTPSGTEVDFVWSDGDQHVLIEVKAARKFRNEHLSAIRSFTESKTVKRSFVVYLGSDSLKVDDTLILPATEFLKRLSDGQVIGA
jgi:predicted AAA+ superfamily ATPase